MDMGGLVEPLDAGAEAGVGELPGLQSQVRSSVLQHGLISFPLQFNPEQGNYPKMEGKIFTCLLEGILV